MRRTARIMIAISAAAPLLGASAAHAAAPCVTSAEFASLVQFALPSIVEGATARCRNTLPASAFLRGGAAPLVRRYRQDSAAAWPAAKVAFLKIGNTGKDSDMLMAALPDDGLRSTIDTVVQGLVVSQLPLDACTKVDRLFGDLAPLPARNTADLVALLVDLGSEKKGGKAGPLTLCPA